MEYAIRYELDDGIPVFHIVIPDTTNQYVPELDSTHLFEQIQQASGGAVSLRDLLTAVYRGTPLEGLATVLRTGIDVEPPTAVFYADDFSRAIEYGGWPKVILALRRSHLKRSWLEVSSDTSPEEIDALRESYPTLRASHDGKRLWLSRLAETDTALATDDELASAYWIPGNAAEALQAVIVLHHPAYNVTSDGLPR